MLRGLVLRKGSPAKQGLEKEIKEKIVKKEKTLLGENIGDGCLPKKEK